MSDEPVPLSAALDAVLRALGAPDARAVRGVFDGWVEAVGASVAAHATPVSLDGGALKVEVDHATWATQLRFLEPTILERLAAVAGSGVVTSIELRVRRS